MTDIYALILKEFVERGCAHVTRYPPFFICSIGCHVFNIHNKKRQVAFEAGRIPDYRLPIMFIAPPGFCVDKRAQVMLEDGSFRQLSDVNIGERLASIDGRPNVVLSKCYSVRNGIQLPNGLIVSPEHRVLTCDGWKYAKDARTVVLAYDERKNKNKLRLNEDSIVKVYSKTSNGSNIQIVACRCRPSRLTGVYEMIDLETSAGHFIANHLVVHNSKSFWLEQFCRGVQAILEDSGIDVGFEGAMTEAGFVGTVRFVDGEPIVVQGLANLYKDAIVGIEEFSALTQMMQQPHSSQLDTALLGALDSGWVYKRLAAGDIRYQTNITIWAGCQPARFDLTSGLGRRFLFIEFIPTRLDFQLLKIARRRSKNKAYNPVRTKRIRLELRRFKDEVGKIEKVVFDPKVYEFFDKYNIVHYEEMLMERLLLGYTLMRGRIGKTVYVTLDDISRQLILREMKYRESIRRGSEFAEVIMIMREHGGKMKMLELKERLLYYGKDWTQSTQLIQQLARMKVLRLHGDEVELSPALRGDTNQGNKRI